MFPARCDWNLGTFLDIQLNSFTHSGPDLSCDRLHVCSAWFAIRDISYNETIQISLMNLEFKDVVASVKQMGEKLAMDNIPLSGTNEVCTPAEEFFKHWRWTTT